MSDSGMNLLLTDLTLENLELKDRIAQAKLLASASIGDDNFAEQLTATLDGLYVEPQRGKRNNQLVDSMQAIQSLIMELYRRDAQIFDTYHQIYLLSRFEKENKSAYHRCLDILIKNIGRE
jgi:hypothetical protein